MTIIDEIKLKYPNLPPSYIDRELEKWKLENPNGSLEDLKVFISLQRPEGFVGDSDYNLNTMMEPTFTCNARCIYCCNEEVIGKTEPPSLEELYKQIDSMPSGGQVFIAGGEPTTRDDLALVFKRIKEKGKKVHLSTNGIRLNDEKYLEGLLPYLDTLVLPIHSNDYRIFDAVTRVKGSAEKVISVFKKLSQTKGVFVVVQTVINQLNYKTLVSTLDMIYDLAPSIKSSILAFPVPTGGAKSTTVTPKYSEIREYLLLALEKYGSKINTYNIPKCWLYPYQNTVLSSAGNDCEDETYCLEGRERNYGKYMKSPSCEKCIFDTRCHGVWKEYGELYPDLDLTPILPP